MALAAAAAVIRAGELVVHVNDMTFFEQITSARAALCIPATQKKPVGQEHTTRFTTMVEETVPCQKVAHEPKEVWIPHTADKVVYAPGTSQPHASVLEDFNAVSTSVQTEMPTCNDPAWILKESRKVSRGKKQRALELGPFSFSTAGPTLDVAEHHAQKTPSLRHSACKPNVSWADLSLPSMHGLPFSPISDDAAAYNLNTLQLMSQKFVNLTIVSTRMLVPHSGCAVSQCFSNKGIRSGNG